MEKLTRSLKVIINITKYSIRMFFRDRSAVYFSLFIPLLIMSIFGLLNLDQQNIKVQLGIVNEANNEASNQVLEGMKNIETLVIHEGSMDSEMSELKKSNRDLVLVLPKDFAGNLVALKSGQNVAQVKPQNLEIFVNDNKTNADIQIGLTILDKVFDQFTHKVSNTPNLFALAQKTVESRQRRYVDFIIPGVAAMSVMQMSLFGVVGAIVSWREKGVLKRLLATPIKPSNIILSQVITRLIITLLQISVLIGVGVLAFKMQIIGSLLSVFLLAFLGGIVFLSMGFAISGMASTQNSVMAVANLVVMPQMFLSGVFFPSDALPNFVRTVTDYFPLTFLSHSMREVMINGATLYQVRTDVWGLVVWAVIVFFLASKYFRWE